VAGCDLDNLGTNQLLVQLLIGKCPDPVHEGQIPEDGWGAGQHYQDVPGIQDPDVFSGRWRLQHLASMPWPAGPRGVVVAIAAVFVAEQTAEAGLLVRQPV
jgi:hypothetical protein